MEGQGLVEVFYPRHWLIFWLDSNFQNKALNDERFFIFAIISEEKLYRFVTAGESHGRFDSCRFRIPIKPTISESYINNQLRRRQTDMVVFEWKLNCRLKLFRGPSANTQFTYLAFH